MRLTLEALEVLDAIQRKGSFAAAAEALHRVPSAVTYAVQKLEEDLGIALFDRSGHRAVLTDAGAELLREGRFLLEAATELEARVKRVATGFEAELRIALVDLIPGENLLPVIADFYQAERCGTRVRVLKEVLGGVWDALASGRADLAIGANGEGPLDGGYSTFPLGSVEFVFMVAPNHPLAGAKEPLAHDAVVRHRAVAAADSSRDLAPRTVGVLSGQDVLTVPDTQAKIEAQRAGLGVGYVPKHLALKEAAAGRLTIKQVEESKLAALLFVAWRADHQGKALQWFLRRLEDKKTQRLLLS